MEQADHKAQLGPRPARLERADPLPRDAHASRQFVLAQAKLQSASLEQRSRGRVVESICMCTYVGVVERQSVIVR